MESSLNQSPRQLLLAVLSELESFQTLIKNGYENCQLSHTKTDLDILTIKTTISELLTHHGVFLGTTPSNESVSKLESSIILAFERVLKDMKGVSARYMQEFNTMKSKDSFSKTKELKKTSESSSLLNSPQNPIYNSNNIQNESGLTLCSSKDMQNLNFQLFELVKKIEALIDPFRSPQDDGVDLEIGNITSDQEIAQNTQKKFSKILLAKITNTDAADYSAENDSLYPPSKISTDPLESTNFEVRQYIDSFFPDKLSPEAISTLSQNLKQKLKDANQELSALLLDKNNQSQQNQSRLLEIKSEIQNLQQNILSIKQKALETELAVSAITSDIKTLDYAKKNLTQAIIVFKKLQMLNTGIKQIQTLLPQKQYKEVIPLFDASTQLIKNFEDFVNVKEINTIKNSLHKLINEAQNLVLSEIQKGINVHGAIVGNVETLSNICLLAHSIGFSKRIIDHYVDIQLRSYQDIYQLKDDVSQLENISRRYSWLIRILRNYSDEHSSIFPAKWSVDLELCIKFCALTKAMIIEQLKNADKIDIDVMISALTSSIAFETQLDKKFDISKQVDETTGQILFLDFAGTKRDTFKSSISSVFGPYLFRYIAAEDKMYSELIHNSRNIDEDLAIFKIKDLFALSSSTELLYRYGVTIMDCIDKMHAICLIINTADYCVTSVKQLGEKMQEKIISEFYDQISFEKSHNCLMGAINDGVDSLVAISLELCNSGFSGQSKLTWANNSGVEDQLEYSLKLLQRIDEVGAEQLLLDFQPIKSTIMQLPQVKKTQGSESLQETFSSKANSIYVETVKKNSKYVESILKTLLAPIDDPVKFVNQYISLFPVPNLEVFEQLLLFKGVKGSGNIRKFAQILSNSTGNLDNWLSPTEDKKFDEILAARDNKADSASLSQIDTSKSDKINDISLNNSQKEKSTQPSSLKISALQKFGSFYLSPQFERTVKPTNPFDDSVSPELNTQSRSLKMQSYQTSEEMQNAQTHDSLQHNGIINQAFSRNVINSSSLNHTDNNSSVTSNDKNSIQSLSDNTQLSKSGIQTIFEQQLNSFSGEPKIETSDSSVANMEMISSPILSNIAANATATKNMINMNFKRIVSNIKTRKTT
ncbi:hypothetical protein BB561_003823 [Smittium simulii]|uniref:Uncharacterized protein n=1 Tax=Smittium simulii TaxID=133385 RepID=A0A2T9YJD3_9FUNG|nr:hypothetical protein BB561_003823 [Smittium simulii]